MKAIRKYLAALLPHKTRLAVQISVCSSLARLVSGKRNVAMFHIGRCGSTVLANALDEHSKINSRSEIFHELTPWIEDGKIQYGIKDIILYHKLDWRFRLTVVEVKFSESEDLGRLDITLEKLIELLKQAGFDHFIILERRNKLRREVSAIQGNIRNRFHYRPEEKVPNVQVDIDLNKLCKKMKQFEHEYDQLRELLEAEDTLEIFYEDDILPDLRIAYEKICNWLRIQCQDYKVSTRRTGAEPLNKSISNYNEVVESLEGTKYEWMLERDQID